MATTHPFSQLPDPPKDAISSVQFSPDGQLLLVGTWANSAHVYRRAGPDADFVLQETLTFNDAVLGACWGADEHTTFAVGLDSAVTMHLDGHDEPIVLSRHAQPSNKVAFSQAFNLVLSTAWDATFHAHDPISRRYVRIQLPQKAYALALSADKAVVAMADRHVWVFALRDLQALIAQDGGTTDAQPLRDLQPWQQRESNLKFMTRAVACMPNGEGFATTSIEGRVSVEWFDPARDEDKYAFKCHRQPEQDLVPGTGQLQDVDMIYPVNAITFHPQHGTFATGGGDGVVMLWDAKTKRRIRHYPRFPACVAAMDYSPDGKYLAVGVCTGFEQGLEGLTAEEIGVYVRKLDDNEAKGKAPKEKSAKN